MIAGRIRDIGFSYARVQLIRDVGVVLRPGSRGRALLCNGAVGVAATVSVG